MAKTIGVLGLQGDFTLHIATLKRIHASAKVVRWPDDLSGCDGLILPGGESTTFMNLMEKTGLRDAIPEFSKNYPLFGTCAGLIVLSSEVLRDGLEPLGVIDLAVERNAYGRQIDSFSERIRIPLFSDNPVYEAVFIRAPKIHRLGSSTQALGFHGDEIVLARNENVLVATFHPELTNDPRIHEYFIREFVK